MALEWDDTPAGAPAKAAAACMSSHSIAMPCSLYSECTTRAISSGVVSPPKARSMPSAYKSR